MKAKPTAKNGGVVLELGPNEQQLREEMPFRIGRILVPVDFSECSRKALQYAIAFASQFGASLHLLHVQETPPAGCEMGYVEYLTLKDSREELDSLKKSIDDEVTVTTGLVTGAPFHEIVEAARDLRADLIIISTHGRKGIQRMLLGSTTEKVVRYAPCPVLVVREAEREFLTPPRGAICE